MSAVSFVTMPPNGEWRVEIAYRDEVRTARIIRSPCKLEVIRFTGASFSVVLLTSGEAHDGSDELLRRRMRIAHEMLADVMCFEVDVDVTWVWNCADDFVRHENTRITRELLGMAAS